MLQLINKQFQVRGLHRSSWYKKLCHRTDIIPSLQKTGRSQKIMRTAKFTRVILVDVVSVRELTRITDLCRLRSTARHLDASDIGDTTSCQELFLLDGQETCTMIRGLNRCSIGFNFYSLGHSKLCKKQIMSKYLELFIFVENYIKQNTFES